MSEPPADAVATVPSRGATAPPTRRTLLIMAGDDVRVAPLPLRGEVTIGRGSKANVQIDAPSISRAHASLALTEDAVLVTDLGSANGTSLRGARLPSGVAVRVSANEAIGVGDVTVVVQELRPVAKSHRASAERPSGHVARSSRDPLVLDPTMRRLYDLAARVAHGSISVLLVGETGTGKEVLAEFLHRASPRGGERLVRVNCAALTESLVESELFGHERGAFTGAQRERPGLLEAADRGTVFLDEIGELSAPVQAKLLRVLEEGHVLRVGSSAPRPLDVRFIAATNRDLEAEVADGRFRRDLYFRLAGAVLAIPPLRERNDEIEALARRFADEASRALGRDAAPIAPAALERLRAHDWPGNVRELRNVIERAVLLAEGAIEAEHLPFDASRAATATATAAPSASTLADEMTALERQRILDALERCGGNQSRAAELLGMPRRTLLKRLDQYGVRRPRKR